MLLKVIVGSQNDKNMAATYIEYENNNSIIEQIKSYKQITFVVNRNALIRDSL